MYERAKGAAAASWPQVEDDFLDAMSRFDSGLAATYGVVLTDSDRTQLAADVQNGKGDFFNDLLALLLENCAGIPNLYARRKVPGLIVRDHNLDGVYPETGRIEFLLEAKMMGTPRTARSPGQKPGGRPGSADVGKRVRELAFKSIDLKGEYSRLRVAEGKLPTAGGPGGGDLTAWLRGVPPRIYCFMAVRVLSETDFQATLRWARAAQQVLDAVGLYCYEPVAPDSLTRYRPRPDVPVELQLERVLHKACLDLQNLKPTQT